MNESLQGWCTDPYARHEARWFSQGVPRGLVRDGRKESQDLPPQGSPTVASSKIDVDTSSSFGSDLVRADDVTHSPYDPKEIKQAAFDVFSRTMPTQSFVVGGGERYTPGTWPPGGSAAGPKRRSLTLAGTDGHRLGPVRVQSPCSRVATTDTRHDEDGHRQGNVDSDYDEKRRGAILWQPLGKRSDARSGLEPSDNGRVITIYVGQVFELDFGNGALTSSVGGTLCAAGDSGTPTGPDDEDIAIGDYDYGAIGKGTDFVALPQSGGGKAVFEVSIVSAPASGLSAAQIALRGIGLLLVIAGIFLWIRESAWWKRLSATAVKGR